MRAIVLEGSDASFRTDYPAPQLVDGEVLVRVLRAGICETDLQLIRGYMGFRGVLGHEFVGIAEAGPTPASGWSARSIAAAGGATPVVSGRPTHCPNRTTIGIDGHDGAFADLIAVPQRNLHRGSRLGADRRGGLYRTAGRGVSDPGTVDGEPHRSGRRARRRPSRQSLRTGAGGHLRSRDRRRQTSGEAGAAERARHRDGAARRISRPTSQVGATGPTSSSIAPARRPGCRPRSSSSGHAERSC